MTTTDPKLIEPDERAMTIWKAAQTAHCEAWHEAAPDDVLALDAIEEVDAYSDKAAATILAAAINEAVQKERAGIVAWLRADARDYGYPESAIRIELADAIEAHKESGHG